MAFNRPSLNEIIERVRNDFQSRLTSGSAVLRRSVVSVFSRVIAGASHLLHGHLDWVFRQVFPDTAEKEQLDRWASIWGVARKPADFAAGQVVFTGTNGSVIPSGSELQRSDGIKFTTNASATISGGSATVAVTAVVAGAESNTESGVQVSLTSPIAGVQSAATVHSVGIEDGQDEESDDDLRNRLLQRIQNPPLGGSADDFERWALEVSGVTRAWVYPLNQGPGTVGLAFVEDNEADIFPSPTKVAEVQDYIDARRPVTIEATVFAPTPFEIDFTIEPSPDSPEVRAAIEAELEDLIRREGQPGGTILISHIREAISIAAGEEDYILTAPTGNVVADPGELPVMGTITWV